MFDCVLAPIFRKIAELGVLLVLLCVAGCGIVQNVISPVLVLHPVWMADGWVYYLRSDDPSAHFELWRQREGREEEFFLNIKDVPGTCGAFDFLFRATDSSLGIATQCADDTLKGVHTELMTYSLHDKTFSVLASTPFLGNIALQNGTATGYVLSSTKCGAALKPIQDGIVGEFAKPITVAGKSWILSGPKKSDCQAAWIRSPVLAPDGTVYFLAAPASLQQPPATDPDHSNQREWYLCSWDGHSDTSTVVTTIRGLASLAISPDGQFIAAASDSGISMINTASGQTTVIVKDQKAWQPNISPDGKHLVYTSEDDIRFKSLPSP